MTSHIDSDTGTDAGMTPTVTLQMLAAAGDQPGWRVLDTARTQQFTGEITFQTQPSISVYFDGGVAYHAVRAGDPSLCTRLVDAGVVEPAQVERGVIRVGNVENLGRLFDRDASIDSDAVMVVLELATDDVVTTIANTVSGPFTLTAYRHHVSGVHRWFVSPGGSGEQPAQLTPVGEVAQIDGSVTDHLPEIAAVLADDDVHIEWDQPIPNEHDAAPAIHTIDDDLLSLLAGEIDEPTSIDVAPVAPAVIEEIPSAIVPPAGPFAAPAPITDLAPAADVPPMTDLAPPADVAPIVEFAPLIDSAPLIDPAPISDPAPTTNSGIALVPPSAELNNDPTALAQDVSAVDAVVHDDFQILWPDGSEQDLTGIDISTTDDSVDDIVDTDDGSPGDTARALAPATLVDEQPDPVAVESEAVDAPISLSFEMPSLTLTADNVPDEQQPDEVVDAVRRAIDAIEAASAGPTQLPSVEVGSVPEFESTKPLQFDVDDPFAHDTNDATVATSSTTADSGFFALESVLPFDEILAADAAPGGAAATATDAAESAVPVPAPASLGGFAPPTANDSAEAVYARAAAVVEQPLVGSASDVTSVVFVDEAPDETDDRSGALKRLIGSLRRK